MKKILLFLLMLFVPFMIHAEELKLEWQKGFGGNSTDYIRNLIVNDNEEIIALGTTSSTDIEGFTNKGGNDTFILKYDKNGNLLWQRHFGGSESDVAYNLIESQDGDIFVAGETKSTDIEGLTNKGENDALIIKYDKNGKLLWQRSFGGSGSDGFSEVKLTKTGDIIVRGYTRSTDIEGLTLNGGSDIIIVKYDKDGNLLWQRSFGGNVDDYLYNATVNELDELVVIGYVNLTDSEGSSTSNGYDALIIKYDKDGNILWQRRVGGSGDDYIYKFTMTELGDIIGYGYTSSTDIEGLSNKGEKDAFIVKYDKDGNLLWQKNYGGSGTDEFGDVKLTKTGDMVVRAYTKSTDIEGLTTNGKEDGVIVKYDKDGNLIWQRCFGGSNPDGFINIKLTEKDDIISYGFTKSTDIEGLTAYGGNDVFIVKYDKDGNLLWKKNFGGSGYETITNSEMTKNQNIILYGSTASTDINGLETNGSYDAFLLIYDKDGNLLWQKSYGGSGVENSFSGFSHFVVTKNENIIIGGYTTSTDIEGLTPSSNGDVFILKYFIEYDLEVKETNFGTPQAVQKDLQCIVTPTPKEGYEVDEIIVKNMNGEVLDVETTKLEDGTYSFPLFTDVSIEVLYKEKIVNPKTGVADYTIFLIGVIIVFLISYYYVSKINNSYNLEI